MIEVVGVRFLSSGKEYYFAPNGGQYAVGEEVIVETARGTEFGTVTLANTERPEAEVVKPLRKVVRPADDRDRQRYEENKAKQQEALATCQEKVDARGLDMKIVDVEYTFDRSKVVFYFTAEGRVDFRDLVKDLASVFRTRIELRQIGVRDEAKLLGGVGNCGRGLCCHEWMPDFQPVSIKMAKTQNLSLNPTKISGMCGRLMCCLKFENEIYQELGRGMPNVGERILVPEGEAVVTDVNILIDKIKCRLITTETNADGEEYEKFSSELYTYSKEDITRQDRRRGRGGQKSGRKGKGQGTGGRGGESRAKADERGDAREQGDGQPKKCRRRRRRKPDGEKAAGPREEHGAQRTEENRADT